VAATRDLVIGEQYSAGDGSTSKTDAELRYLTEQEHAIPLLDGRTSVSEIQRVLPSDAPPVTAVNCKSCSTQLHRSGLVLGEAAGQGEALASRQANGLRLSLLRLAEKVLSFRWRGVNPEPLLRWLDPKIGWFFSPVGAVVWLLVVAWALLLAVTQLDELSRRMPDVRVWMAGDNLIWLGLATIGVKTLHELGHALAARRVGCRCHEIGVQLFFLLPCLYTNVSDVWLVPSKWRRIAVSAAGIYVELFLAAVAMLAWWRAEPGCCRALPERSSWRPRHAALNGNPCSVRRLLPALGRGEVPNLEQTSRADCSRCRTLVPGRGAAERTTFRGRASWPRMPPRRLVYRALLIGVYFTLRTLLGPYRLEPLGDVLLAMAVLGMLIPLAVGLTQQVRQARRRRLRRFD
jgi:putative peptide zinc metalloprotease protein